MNKKKVIKFIDSNFPPYTKCTIIEDKKDMAIALLEYSKYDKMKVTVGYGDDSHTLYKLLQTDFI